jgi:hypothetical protein
VKSNKTPIAMTFKQARNFVQYPRLMRRNPGIVAHPQWLATSNKGSDAASIMSAIVVPSPLPVIPKTHPLSSGSSAQLVAVNGREGPDEALGKSETKIDGATGSFDGPEGKQARD